MRFFVFFFAACFCRGRVSGEDCEKVAEGSYLLTVQHSGKVLSVNNGSLREGTRIVQWKNDDTVKGEIWNIERSPSSSRFNRIVAYHSGMAMALEDHTKKNGAKLRQTREDRGNDEEWCMVKVGSNGYYKIVNRYSGKVAEVRNASNANEAPVVQNTWAGRKNQKWKLKRVDPPEAKHRSCFKLPSGSYRVVNEHSGKAMRVRNGSNSGDARIVQWDDKISVIGTAWTLLIAASEGVDTYYNMVALHSGLGLKVPLDQHEQQLVQRRNNAGQADDWCLTFLGNGQYKLLNRLNNKVAQVDEGSAQNGDAVTQGTWRNEAQQKWKLTKVADLPNVRDCDSSFSLCKTLEPTPGPSILTREPTPSPMVTLEPTPGAVRASAYNPTTPTYEEQDWNPKSLQPTFMISDVGTAPAMNPNQPPDDRSCQNEVKNFVLIDAERNSIVSVLPSVISYRSLGGEKPINIKAVIQSCEAYPTRSVKFILDGMYEFCDRSPPFSLFGSSAITGGFNGDILSAGGPYNITAIPSIDPDCIIVGEYAGEKALSRQFSVTTE